MIATQLDTLLIGSTVYARIVNPANPAQVWDTNAQAFANRSGVTAANMAVSGTVDTSGWFEAAEPTGFTAGLIADCTLHEQAGGSPALGDEPVGAASTNTASIAVLTTTEQGRIDAAITSRLADEDYTAPPSTTEIAVEVESHLVDDGDATALLQAIANKLEADFDLGELSSATIAAAVWNTLLVSISTEESVGKLLKQILASLDEMIEESETEQKRFTEDALQITGLYANTSAAAEILAAATEVVDDDTPYVRFKSTALEEAPAAGLTPEQAQTLNNIKQAVEDLPDQIEFEAGRSGGGVLTAKVSDSSLAPNKFLEIIQGEEKKVTFIVTAEGRFDVPSAQNITVKFRDTKKNVIVVENEDIERVCEALDIQVLRATILPEKTQQLVNGLVRIELSFDDQKAVLTHSMKILEGIIIPDQGSEESE